MTMSLPSESFSSDMGMQSLELETRLKKLQYAALYTRLNEGQKRAHHKNLYAQNYIYHKFMKSGYKHLYMLCTHIVYQFEGHSPKISTNLSVTFEWQCFYGGSLLSAAPLA